MSMHEGLVPNNAAHVMRLICAPAAARGIADLIVESFDPAECAAGAFEIEDAQPSWDETRTWIVEVFFADEPDEDFVRGMIAAVADEATAAAAVFERVAQKDWVASSLEGLKPVRAGRFLVHGSHSRDAVASNDIGLEIEAALAFGTGHHGTTRGCLLMLDRILKRRRPRCILDVGSGTGVLALAAARYLHQPVAAGDIDPIAVEAARANARLNGATPWVRPVVAKGLEHPRLKAAGPFDLIFANILAKPLRLLAPSICANAADGADIVLSGLLDRDVPGVLTAYAAGGFALVSRGDLEGWACLWLRRGGAAPRPDYDD
jgi:ribosomal protein L11 methyltransferase